MGGYLICNAIKAKKIIGEIIKKFRVLDIFIILTSLIFYAWACFDDVIWLLQYVVIIYLFGVLIEKERRSNCKIEISVSYDKDNFRQKPRKILVKRALIIMPVLIIIVTAILFYYKYYNFLLEELNKNLYKEFRIEAIFPPLGISFITFSAISYIVDIYRGTAKGGNLIDVMLYITFFPKVISGPVVLYKDFSHQIKDRNINLERFVSGLNLIMLGLAEKVILADTFGRTLSSIYSSIQYGIDVPTAWGASLLYMLQLYFDFCGYSRIAIGLSNLFGFEIKENFNYPYLSRSITEFWKRWHISLGAWFREYIYIPLGGNKKGQYRTLCNLFFVFLLTGIWHGAGWNYICWGILNGSFVVIERCISKLSFYKKIPGIIKWIFSMFIVYFSWQMFRCSTIKEFNYFIDIMLGRKKFDFINYEFQYFFDFKLLFLTGVGVVCSTIPGLFRSEKYNMIKSNLYITYMKEILIILLFIGSIICMVNSTFVPFLYFRY